MVCSNGRHPKKNGDPQRTVDLQKLNKAASREVHHSQSPFNMNDIICPNWKTGRMEWIPQPTIRRFIKRQKMQQRSSQIGEDWETVVHQWNINLEKQKIPKTYHILISSVTTLTQNQPQRWATIHRWKTIHKVLHAIQTTQHPYIQSNIGLTPTRMMSRHPHVASPTNSSPWQDAPLTLRRSDRTRKAPIHSSL